MAKITGLIEKINKKTGETNGKQWTLYGYFVNGAWYSTFKEWNADEGMMVSIEFDTDKEGRKTIKNVELNQDTFKPQTANTTTTGVSNGTSIVRQNALRHADALLEVILDPNRLTKQGREAYILKKYFSLAEMIEEWIQRPAGLSFSESSDPEEEEGD